MANIFIFTAADISARENFRKTVEEGVSLDLVLPHISRLELQDQLRNAFTNGRCFLWGSQQKSGENRITWEKMEPDDLVLGYRNRSIVSAGYLVSKVDSPSLARDLWGNLQEPFQLIYFFSKPVLCNVPVARWPAFFGEEYRGFSTVSPKRVAKILDEYGSLNEFVARCLESGTHGADSSEAPTVATPRRYWVEKTIVAGRPDRESGPHALGLALWSPQRSADSADIYRLMREVRSGDVVFHLVDNERIDGVSVVAAPADDSFVGLDGTDWAGKPGYRIPLRNFTRLAPPLDRKEFLEDSAVRPLLRRLLESHRLFYNRGLTLNQGAYLTEAPEELVRLWNQIYKSQAGVSLPHLEGPVLETAPALSRTPKLDLQEVVNSFTRDLTACGISFGARTLDICRAFVASLATKRFVILTGLSGSGKTQIALQFGRWLGANRVEVVPVRPDWTGAEAVFGYEDALQRTIEGRGKAWHVPGPLAFMLKAARDPEHPYLLLLDEMNLAHVERYLADLLSGMESRTECLPNLDMGEDGSWRVNAGGAPKLPVPSNLFLVGTVNVDETTYMFSPKVLDRANTMEFRVQTNELVIGAHQVGSCREGPAELVRGFLEIARDTEWQHTHRAPGLLLFTEKMQLLHSLLSEGGFEFGHRLFFESLRFASMLSSAGNQDPYDALDYQVLQKVLPRLHGSRRRLEPTLCAVARFCFDISFLTGSIAGRATQQFDPEGSSGDSARLPKSFEKSKRMARNLRANQFTSFTE